MRYLIVDGHSVIFAWPELLQLHRGRTGAARARLVKLLEAYQDASGVRVVAVFDGKGAKTDDDSAPGSIQVFYSSSGQTADQIIERLAATYASRHEITVATSDLMEQQTVTTFGAIAISAERLREYLAEAESDLSRRLRTHHKKSGRPERRT